MYALLSMDIYNTSHNNVFSDFNTPFVDKHVSKQWVIQHGPKTGSWKTTIYSIGLEFGDKWLHFMPMNAGKGAEVF